MKFKALYTDKENYYSVGIDEETGEILWAREWPVDYAGLQPTYAIGPRATHTVDGGPDTVWLFT